MPAVRPFRAASPLLLCLAMLCGAVAVRAQDPKPAGYENIFDKSEAMIAARDGTQLHTEIYSPKKPTEPLPIILVRTPYGISAPDKGFSTMLRRYADMIPEGYIFVFQDIRGRNGRL